VYPNVGKEEVNVMNYRYKNDGVKSKTEGIFREVFIKHKGDKNKTKHIYYEKWKADELSLDYVHWKDAEITENSQWVLTDDDIVVESLATRMYAVKGRVNRKFYKLPVGDMFWYMSAKTKLLRVRDLKERLCDVPDIVPGNMRGTIHNRWKNYATAMAITGDRDVSISMAFGNVNAHRFRTLLNESKEEVREGMVREQLEKLLIKHGMGIDFTMDLLSKTIKMAEKNGNVSALLKAIENLQELNDIKSKTTTTTSRTAIAASETMKYIDSLGEELDGGDRELKIANETIKEVK